MAVSPMESRLERLEVIDEGLIETVEGCLETAGGWGETCAGWDFAEGGVEIAEGSVETVEGIFGVDFGCVSVEGFGFGDGTEGVATAEDVAASLDFEVGVAVCDCVAELVRAGAVEGSLRFAGEAGFDSLGTSLRDIGACEATVGAAGVGLGGIGFWMVCAGGSAAVS